MRKTATRDGKGGRGRLWGVGVKEGISNGFSVPSDSNLFTRIQILIFFILSLSLCLYFYYWIFFITGFFITVTAF